MEIKKLIISQNNSSLRYSFFNKINVVPSNELSDAILSFSFEGGDPNYVIESEDNLSFADITHIKINLTETGSIIAAFHKGALTMEKREMLFGELSKLRGSDTITKENQEIKMRRIVQLVGDFSPIFLAYYNSGNFVFTKSSLDELLKECEISFPILILLPSLDFEAKHAKARKLFKFGEKETKVAKEKLPKEKRHFVMPKLFTFDYMFFAIFTAFVAFGTFTSIFQILNGEGIAAFVIVLVVAFIITFNFAAYKTYKESDEFEYRISKLWVPVSYVVLGTVIGSFIGLFITQFVMSPKEGVEVNYSLILAIVLSATLLINVASLFSPLLTSKIVAIIANKSAKHE